MDPLPFAGIARLSTREDAPPLLPPPVPSPPPGRQEPLPPCSHSQLPPPHRSRVSVPERRAEHDLLVRGIVGWGGDVLPGPSRGPWHPFTPGQQMWPVVFCKAAGGQSSVDRLGLEDHPDPLAKPRRSIWLGLGKMQPQGSSFGKITPFPNCLGSFLASWPAREAG